MNSAAKLRNRGIALAGATAIVMTSFGPAAFAWDATPTPTVVTDAGAASFGMVDSDQNTAGTQGAQGVQAGKADQLAGEMRFVLPSTWKTNDFIDFEIQGGPGSKASSADYVQWSSLPNLKIDETAYAKTTHVADASNKASGADGSVEDGKAVEWKNAVANSTDKPLAPTYKVEQVGSTPFTKFRVTFLNDSSDLANVKDAKFIGTIRTPKITVGENVSGQITVKATAGGATAANLKFFGAGAVDTTAIAAVQTSRLDVTNGQVTADGTAQGVGPITFAPVSGAFGTAEDVILTVSGGTTFDTASKGKVAWYDKDGKLLNPTAVDTAPTDATTINAGTAPAGATKLVLSGYYAKSTALTTTYSVASVNDGLSVAPVTAFAAVHQTDIAVPAGNATVTVTNVKDSGTDRLAGADRYQTAVAVAKSLAPTARDGQGNVANVVLVSGSSYADALSASYLATVKKAPILLTTGTDVSPAVQEYLRTNGVKNVYIIGDAGVVSNEVEKTLAETAATNKTAVATDAVATQNKLSVTRLGGKDRFATNRLANQFAVQSGTDGVIGTTYTTFGKPKQRTVILASGMTPWDSLAAGSLVGGDKADSGKLPIVLTYGTKLANDALAQVNTLGVQHAITVGGADLVPDSVLSGLSSSGVTSVRLAGKDRYATNRAVIDFMVKGAPTQAEPNGGLGFVWAANAVKPILANSGQPNKNGWADALAVSPLAALNHQPMVLTPANALAQPVKDTLTAYAVPFGPTALVSGGFAAVSDAAASEANAIIAKS